MQCRGAYTVTTQTYQGFCLTFASAHILSLEAVLRLFHPKQCPALLYYSFKNYIHFHFIWKTEREKERISTIGSLPQMLTTPAAGPHGTKSYKLSLQYECLGSKSWSHHRRPPRVQKTRAEAKETTSHSRVPNGNLTLDQTFACITPLPRLLKLSGVPAVLVLKLDSSSCFCKMTLHHAIYQVRIFFLPRVSLHCILQILSSRYSRSSILVNVAILMSRSTRLENRLGQECRSKMLRDKESMWKFQTISEEKLLMLW